MKNEKLKQLMAAKVAQNKQHPYKDVEILNRDMLVYAQGGGGTNCPMLTSCGTYGSNNCGVKFELEQTTQ